jgi:soluble lytic murein transglycosylase-like protein
MIETAAEQKKAEETAAKAEAEAKAAEEAMAKEVEEAQAAQKILQQEAIAKLPEAIVDSKTPVVQSVNTAEGVKNVVAITMELVEDHIPKRAEKFKEMISKHSAAYSVDEPLIYAIMEQESAFNPMAQSWVPAYGLMQLVPKSGGRDAYRYVHKTDAIPSADFLFNPDNNIQLGTGYLKLLMSTTFKKVEDPRCRMLCAIAAYNTGAGNVSRAINGTTNISKAIPSINKMSYDQLFNHLKASLPHDETKDYIQKVTSKMQKYTE